MELDRLLSEMTEYYSADENRTVHTLKEVIHSLLINLLLISEIYIFRQTFIKGVP